MFPHDGYLAGAIVNILDAYRAGAAGVNGTLVVLDRDELTLVIKHGPVLLQ
jgi:hypothetical protein